MNIEFFKKNAKIFRNIYTSLYATLASLLFGKLYFESTVQFTHETEIIFEEAHQLFFFNLLALAIVLFAVIMIYYYFDNLDLFNKKDYLEDKKKRLLISKPEYLFAFAVSMLFAVAIFTEPIHSLLSVFGNVPKLVSRILAVLTMALIRLIQIYNLQVKWEDEITHPLFAEKPIFKNSLDIEKFSPIHLIIRPLGYFFIYTLCYLFTSKYLIAIVFSVYLILTSLWQGILLIVLIPFIVLLIIKVNYNLRARAKLLRKLKMMSREGLATVKYNGPKIFSAFFPFIRFSVEVRTRTGELYICRILSSGGVNSPMYFTPDKFYTEHGFHLRGGGLISSMGASPFAAIVDIGKIGGNTNPTNLIAGYHREHDITFPEGEGQRTVIINPTPTACFSLYGIVTTPIDTGEDMKKYTIHTATGFYNMIERHVNRDRFEK